MKKTRLLICILMIAAILSGCSPAIDESTSAVADVTELHSSETVSTSSIQNETTAQKFEPVATTLQETTVVTTTKLPETTLSVTTTEVTIAKTTEKQVDTCTVTILCSTINDNIDDLKSSKLPFVPSDGIILEKTTVEIENSKTAFDVIRKACYENVCKDDCTYCQRNGIQIEYTYTPAFDNYYIEGIHQIYEMDCGMQSGWMFSVNGEFPNVGASAYSVNNGDEIVFAYTCNMGEDIGNLY